MALSLWLMGKEVAWRVQGRPAPAFQKAGDHMATGKDVRKPDEVTFGSAAILVCRTGRTRKGEGLTFLLSPLPWRDQAVFTFHKKWLDVRG